MAEKYKNIKEKRPIVVSFEKSESGNYLIEVAPMRMRYETAKELGDNLKLTEYEWDYRKRVGYKGEGEERLRMYQNDVRLFQYSYEDGKVTFLASTKKDVENWMNLYNRTVTNQKPSKSNNTTPMTLEAELRQLLENTAVAPSSNGNGGVPFSGKVNVGQLDEGVIALIRQNQVVELRYPNDIVIKTKAGQNIPSFHKIIDDLLQGNNVFLVGPAGTGKTTLAEMVAEAIGIETKTINGNEWTAPTEIIGGQTIEGYKQGKFVEAWSDGKLLILDEMPKLNPNTAGLLNDGLAKAAKKGAVIEDQAGDKHVKHEKFGVVATGNVTGKGFVSQQYGGNNRQDASLLDRFSTSIYFIDFNRPLEKANTFKMVFEIFDKMRDVILEMESEEIITLRTMLNANRIYQLEMEREIGNVPKVQGGKTLKDCIESYLSAMADEDEAEQVKDKAGLKEFYNQYRNTADYMEDRKRFVKT